MKLRYSPTSPFVRKVMVAAIETGLIERIEKIPTSVTPIKPNDDVARDNPLVKVPALTTDDGLILYDSPVICEYLDTLHDGTNASTFNLTVTANNTTVGEAASSAPQTIAVDIPVSVTGIASGAQGSNGAPSIITVTFANSGLHQTFSNTAVSMGSVIHLNPSAGNAAPTFNFTTLPSFDATGDIFTFYIDKNANNGASYTISIDAGAFADVNSNFNTPFTSGSLKPAGIAGESINLGLTDPTGDGSDVMVTIAATPADWVINGATHNADGSWTDPPNEGHRGGPARRHILRFTAG